MATRLPLMAGNWKSNLNHQEAVVLVQKLTWTLQDKNHEFAKAEVALIPPFTDIRSVQVATIGGPAEVVAADLSFISLRTVLPALVSLAAPGAVMVVLVKPQFEAGRRAVSKGRGVVRDPAVWRLVLDRFRESAESGGASIMGVMVSPLTGANGNVEFLVHLVAPSLGSKPVGPVTAVDLDDVVATAVELHQR
jgi:23S rRNA (cytidine1920-2'-O)/16S rRNA (cytidine1409-2'-O)-methyltransferase